MIWRAIRKRRTPRSWPVSSGGLAILNASAQVPSPEVSWTRAPLPKRGRKRNSCNLGPILQPSNAFVSILSYSIIFWYPKKDKIKLTLRKWRKRDLTLFSTCNVAAFSVSEDHSKSNCTHHPIKVGNFYFSKTVKLIFLLLVYLYDKIFTN